MKNLKQYFNPISLILAGALFFTGWGIYTVGKVYKQATTPSPEKVFNEKAWELDDKIKQLDLEVIILKDSISNLRKKIATTYEDDLTSYFNR